jgi:hypothetical protein
MISLRCTATLLKRLRVPVSPTAAATGRLGDWTAKPLRFHGQRLALCTNERSFLSVVVPTAPVTTFRDRFAGAAQHRINQIPVGASLRLNEVAGLREVRFGRASNRSVLSTMTQLALDAEFWLSDQPLPRSLDLEALGMRLCDTPCSGLSTHWPWLEAELLLAGSIAPESRGLRSRRSVI